MNEVELIEHLVYEIEKRGIEVIQSCSFPLDAITNNKKKVMIFNPTVVTPFKLCHELVHILNHDTHRFGDCDTICTQEKRTNKTAILLLWEEFEKCNGTSDNLAKFIEITGCPDKFSKIIILKSKIKDWDREEIHTQVESYLSSYDEEPENLNIYRIMDSCHIDYEWEGLVDNFIHEYYINNLRTV